MKRHRNRRQNAVQKLNLVALMDIFTILVFFLMVNSSDVQIKETHDSVALPKSTTTDLPSDTLKLYITKNYMFIDGDPQQISLQSFSEKSGTFPELVTLLAAKAAVHPDANSESVAETGLPITILGDLATNYTTIQQVLASCAETSFRDVSLAIVFTGNEAQANTQTNSRASTVTDALAATTTNHSSQVNTTLEL